MTKLSPQEIEEVKSRDRYQSLRLIEISDYHQVFSDRRSLLSHIESQDKDIAELQKELHNKNLLIDVIEEVKNEQRAKLLQKDKEIEKLRKALDFCQRDIICEGGEASYRSLEKWFHETCELARRVLK